MDEQEKLDREFERPHYLDNVIAIHGAEKVLIKGRFLQLGWHDTEAEEHMHMYREVLEDYDPETKTVLLSKEGSRRLRKELETRDKEYSLSELFALFGSSNVRSRGWDLF